MSNSNLQFSSPLIKSDELFSHTTTLFFLIIKLDPLNDSRESGVIFNSTLQNVLATYCSNVLNTCVFPFKCKLFLTLEKLGR